MNCRLCGVPLSVTFADLGMTPLANAFVGPGHGMEPFYPLHAYVCEACFLVQLPVVAAPERIFTHYPYFSSISPSWLAHAELYVEAMVERFKPQSVVEVASNDGYLLQFFGVPVLGIEPAANVAAVAQAKGIPTTVEFFSAALAMRLRAQGLCPDLMVANNVLAHVPDLHDFVEGFAILLAPNGVVTFEFPHLQKLIEGNQFDTIYHEHLSYFSLATVERLLAQHGLDVFDVEELETHGGSLRVYAAHFEHDTTRIADVSRVLMEEEAAGLHRIETYQDFAAKIADRKCDLLAFLIAARREGKKVAAYGAPAKGNTLLNYCGIGPELLAFTVDLSPAKQGLLLPGTRIPIYAPATILEEKPDYLLILPWNLKQEIATQMAAIMEWGGQFVVAIPEMLQWSV